MTVVTRMARGFQAEMSHNLSILVIVALINNTTYNISATAASHPCACNSQPKWQENRAK